MPLNLEVVTESLSPKREHVFTDYPENPGFNWSWWHSGSAKSPVSYCRFTDGEVEVARAKILPSAGEYGGYTSWACPSGGVTEIDLFEVRVSLRGRGYGPAAIELIADHYGVPMVAMSLDDSSDSFWRSLGWTAHTHPEYGNRTLFSLI